jgi:hypothetical protein
MNNFSSYTPEQGVNALDQFIRAVYSSSIDKDIGACDFESLSEFVCGREDPWKTAAWYDKLKAPIRGGLLSLFSSPSDFPLSPFSQYWWTFCLRKMDYTKPC